MGPAAEKVIRIKNQLECHSGFKYTHRLTHVMWTLWGFHIRIGKCSSGLSKLLLSKQDSPHFQNVFSIFIHPFQSVNKLQSGFSWISVHSGQKQESIGLQTKLLVNHTWIWKLDVTMSPGLHFSWGEMWVSLLPNEAEVEFESLCCHRAGMSQWGGGLEIDWSVDESLIEMDSLRRTDYT